MGPAKICRGKFEAGSCDKSDGDLDVLRERSKIGMLGEEVPSAEGVLKMNCKVLDSSQLKKLDKQEKILAQEIHYTGKGKLFYCFQFKKVFYSLQNIGR